MNLVTNPADMLVIFFIMLIFLGPKKMVRYAYILGKYIRELRIMIQQSVKQLFQELALDDLIVEVNGKSDRSSAQAAATTPSAIGAEPSSDNTANAEAHERYSAWIPTEHAKAVEESVNVD